jgi:hypothetical protein
MNNLTIDTGAVQLTINNDPNRVITFNPSDVVFAERFYALMQDFSVKQAEFQARTNELASRDDLAGNIALMRDACEYLRGQVDGLFGAGTSQMVFGDVLSLDAFAQLFEGLTPFIRAARDEKITKYTMKPSERVMK